MVDANEKFLADSINDVLKQVGHSIDVLFQTSVRKTHLIQNVKSTKLTGSEPSSNYGRKADIELITDKNKIPISLKRDSAEYWQSGDKWSVIMRTAMDKLEKEGKISFQQEPDGTWRISQQIAKKAPADVARSAIFGNDILPYGSVISRTFSNSDFDYNPKTNKLTIRCTSIIRNLYDIPQDQKPWLILVHQKDKNISALGKKGLRVRVAYEKRVTNTVLKVA